MSHSRNWAVSACALLGLSGVGLGIVGCSATQLATATTTAEKMVAAGQLYCAKATTAGPLVVAAATAAGAPVSVIGQTAAAVSATCAAIDAIPVSPPANETTAPVVAVPSVATVAAQ